MVRFAIEEIISNRKVVLWGVGNTGKDFYSRYKEAFRIDGCTCSDDDFEPIYGLEGIHNIDITSNFYYVIVCSIGYEEIERHLILRGFSNGQDFIRWDYFACLLDSNENRKKIVAGLGQCEISEICYGLSKWDNISEGYSVIYFNERKVCESADLFSIVDFYDCIFMFGFVDILILPAVFSSKTDMEVKYLRSFLKPDTRIIKIPLLNFDSYWPQDIAVCRTHSKYYVTMPDKKLNAFAERDQVVEQFVEEDYIENDILRQITQNTFFGKDTVMNNHYKTLKRFRLIDRVSDIEISDFIEENYNIKKLFCDRGHFSTVLLREYIIRIAQCLNSNSNCAMDVNLDVLFEGVNEFPIYPSTAHYLKLKFVNNDTQYRMINYGGVHYVSFEEYMRKLIRYYKYSKHLLESCR